MMHNFIGLIYFSIKQVKYSEKYKLITPQPAICLMKNQNQTWEQVLRNRESKSDENAELKNEQKKQQPQQNEARLNLRASQEQEHSMWGVLYTDNKDYDNSNQYKKIDRKKKITTSRLCEILCEQDTNFQIRLFSQLNNQFLAICSFPLAKIQKMPKMKHEIEIQLVNYQIYTKINQLKEEIDAMKLFDEGQYQQQTLSKPFLEEFEDKFQNQLSQHRIMQSKKQQTVAKMTLNMVYIDKNYGRLIFEAVEIQPKPSMSHLAELIQPELIIRVDNREARSNTYKIINKAKVMWYKSVTFEIDRIPSKITITLFNKENQNQEGVANMPVFMSSILLPTKRSKKQIIKLFDENSENESAKVIGEIVVKHRFVPNSI